MNSQQLINVGWRLARPSLVLKEATADEPIVAIWGGPGVIPPPNTTFRHIISIDCRFLPQNPLGLTGWLSVYGNDRFDNSGVVLVDRDVARSTDKPMGLLLRGHVAQSFPPIDAIVQEPAVQVWLTENGWEHNPQKNAYFDDDACTAVFQEHCPIYTDQTIAVLGGWHFPWEDKDWDALRQHTLIVWTFRDAEPWLEVLLSPAGKFEVRERIS